MPRSPSDDEDDDTKRTLMNPARQQQAASGEEPVNDGSTAFVRVDDVPASPPPQRGSPRAEPLAPKKGLQVTLPDDEPAPAPKPKPKVVAAEPEKKGRRGNWWDAKADKSADDEAPPAAETGEEEVGATAYVRAEPAAPPARKRPQPREPEPPADNRTQFYRPDDSLLNRDSVNKERVKPPPAAPATNWKLVVTILAVALVVGLALAVLVYREGLSSGPKAPPKSAPVKHPGKDKAGADTGQKEEEK